MTLTITSLASISSTESVPALDSISCLYEELSHESSYESGKWNGNQAVFIIDDTASDCVPW